MMPNDYPAYAPAAEPRRGTPAWVKVLGGCLIVGVVGLVILSCAAGTTAWAFFHSTPASATTTQTYAVSGAPDISIHNVAGNVRVVRGGDGTVAVQTTKHARAFNAAGAQDELRQIDVQIAQSGNSLTIQVNEPSFASHFRLWDDHSVDFTLTVPAQANIDATANAGNVDIAGIAGTMTIQDNAGDVRLTDVAGTIGITDNAGNITLTTVSLAGSSSATNNAGNIDLSGTLQSGAEFTARTTAGNVTATLPRDTSAHLTASTNAGNLRVDSGWPVSVSHSAAGATASGDLSPNPTGSLTLESTAGNVTLNAR
jgi:hypothetical protein